MSDVLGVYTMPQVHAFVEAAAESESDDFLLAATAVRAAGQTEKDWKNFVADHKRKRERRKPPRPISRSDANRLRLLLGGKGAKDAR